MHTTLRIILIKRLQNLGRIMGTLVYITVCDDKKRGRFFAFTSKLVQRLFIEIVQRLSRSGDFDFGARL